MKKILFGLLGVLLVGVLLGYGASWFFQQNQHKSEEVRVVITDKKPVWQIQLYFTAPTGDYLVPESYEIVACDDDIDCIRMLLDGLVAGSQQENISVLPSETKVLDVVVENDLVRIDFSRHFADFHPGGSLSELLSIYSLANSLNENFPYIRQLQIVIEGEVQQTLKGHARIDQPVYADFSFCQPPVIENIPVPVETIVDSQELSIEEIIQNSENN